MDAISVLFEGIGDDADNEKFLGLVMNAGVDAKQCLRSIEPSEAGNII